MSRYPSDWHVVELGSIGTWRSGGTPSTSVPAYWGGDIPWISAASLKSFDIRDSDRRVTELGANNGTRKAPSGTVLFVVRGMSLKSEFRVGITHREVTFGQDCKAIEVRSGLNARFIAYTLKAKEAAILSMVDEAGHGTGRLPIAQLERLNIGLPNEREQNRVVEMLDSIDHSIHTNETFIAKLERANESILQHTFTTAHSRVNWSPCLLGDLLDGKPKNGYSPQAGSHFSDIYMLGLGCLTPRGFSPSQLKFAPGEDPLLPQAMLTEGDLLINRANTRELVGLVGRYTDIGYPCIYPDLMMRLRVNKRAIPEFLELLLRSPICRRQIKSAASGTSESMVKLNSNAVTNLTVSVPPVDEQQKIAKRHRNLLEGVARAERELAKLRKIKQGLMDDLLTGQVRVPV